MGALMLCYHSVHLVLRLEVETMQKCLKLNTVSESTSASQSLHTFTLSRWRTSVSSYSSCQAPRELQKGFRYDHKFDDNRDRTLICSVSGRLATESFLGCTKSPTGVPTAKPPPVPKAPTESWWGSTILCGIALQTLALPDGV